MTEKKKPFFEGYANIYDESGFNFSHSIFCYPLLEGAMQSVAALDKKALKHLVSERPLRIRVEILDT